MAEGAALPLGLLLACDTPERRQKASKPLRLPQLLQADNIVVVALDALHFCSNIGIILQGRPRMGLCDDQLPASMSTGSITGSKNRFEATSGECIK